MSCGITAVAIYGQNIEHNKLLYWALLKSIIDKNLSIIGRGLHNDVEIAIG